MILGSWMILVIINQKAIITSTRKTEESSCHSSQILPTATRVYTKTVAHHMNNRDRPLALNIKRTSAVNIQFISSLTRSLSSRHTHTHARIHNGPPSSFAYFDVPLRSTFCALWCSSKTCFMSANAFSMRSANRLASVPGQLFFADMWKKTISSPAIMYDTP